MKQNVWTVPPKISVTTARVGQADVAIKIVRNSVLCQWTNKATLIFGNTIYVRDKVLLRKVLLVALQKMERQDEVGKFSFLWKQLRNQS
jgi:hypothetical protein